MLSWETENASHLPPRAAQNLERPPANEAGKQMMLTAK